VNSRIFIKSTIRKRLLLSGVISVMGLFFTVLSDINLTTDSQTISFVNYLFYLIIYFFASFLGITASENIGVSPLIAIANFGVNKKLVRVLIFGIAAGILIGIINTIVLKQSLNSDNLPEWLFHFNSVYDTFILSARAAFMEEIIFRLFLFPGLAWVVLFFLRRIIKKENQRVLFVSIITGIIASSLLFGIMHGSGFLYSSVIGIILCGIFVKGGLESTIIAHFTGNFMSFTYVMN